MKLKNIEHNNIIQRTSHNTIKKHFNAINIAQYSEHKQHYCKRTKRSKPEDLPLKKTTYKILLFITSTLFLGTKHQLSYIYKDSSQKSIKLDSQ